MSKNIVILNTDFSRNALDSTTYDDGTYYSITKTLSHCTISNGATSIKKDTAYNATVTASSNYTLSSVAVYMGNTDVTSTVYSNGSISIPSVTGNLRIVASATINSQATPFDGATWRNGYWNVSGTSATWKSGNTFLTNLFIELPVDNWVITPKTVTGYLVGMRPYTCQEWDSANQTPSGFTRSNDTYGQTSSSVATTLTTDTIKALDPSARYFSLCLYANSASGSGGKTLSTSDFNNLVTVTKVQ